MTKVTVPLTELDFEVFKEIIYEDQQVTWTFPADNSDTYVELKFVKELDESNS